MSKLNLDQRLASVRFRYADHANSVDWTGRYAAHDTAPCGCGVTRLGREMICPTFHQLGNRLAELSEQRYPWREPEYYE